MRACVCIISHNHNRSQFRLSFSFNEKQSGYCSSNAAKASKNYVKPPMVSEGDISGGERLASFWRLG